MKKLIFIFLLAISFQSFGQGNWTLSGAKNRWANGMGFGLKDTSAYTNASDTNLLVWQNPNILCYRHLLTDHWVIVAGYSGTGFLNLSDTASMLSAYTRLQRFLDSTTAIQGRIQTKLAIGDSLAMLNGRISSISLITPNVLYSTPVTFNRNSGAWTGTLSLNTQSPYQLFGTGSGTATPTFRYIDSNYFNGAFAAQVRNAGFATLTFGTHLTGTSYNGSTAATIATDATSANTASTIVARDGSGNFTAGTITAALTGNVTAATGTSTFNDLNLKPKQQFSGTADPVPFLHDLGGGVSEVVFGSGFNYDASGAILHATNFTGTNFIVGATNASPTAGSMYRSSTYGLVNYGIAGSTYDYAIFNSAGNVVMQVPTGGVSVAFGNNVSAATFTGAFTGALTGNATTATTLAIGRTIAITGDITYTSPVFDGSGNVTAAGTLASIISASSAGSASVVPVITWDAKGRLTAVTTATIVAGSTTGVLTLGTDLSGGTFNGSTNVTVNNTSTLATVTGRGATTSTGLTLAGQTNIFGASSFTTTYLQLKASSSARNWQISTNDYVSSALAIGPSTAAGGTTFTNYALLLGSDLSGIFGGNLTVSGGTVTATTFTGNSATTTLAANSTLWNTYAVDLGVSPSSINAFLIYNNSTSKVNAASSAQMKTALGYYTSGDNVSFGTGVFSGNVGIGQAPNTYGLIVNQTTGDWTAGFKNYSSNAFGVSIDLSGSTSVSTNSALQIYTQLGTGLRLINNGQLLIGSFTNHSGETLQVTGNTYITGSLTAGAISGTTGTFNGTITSSTGNSSNSFNANGATTGYNFARWVNTGGNTQLGVDGSAGGFFTGSPAYATVFGSATNTSVAIATNGIVRQTIDGNGNTSWTGTGTFASTVTATAHITTGGTSSQATMGEGSLLTLTKGTYTPTLSNVSGTSGLSANVSQYSRIGDIVTVSYHFVGTGTGTCQVYMSIPVGAVFSSTDQANGAGTSGGNSGYGQVIVYAQSGQTDVLVTIVNGSSTSFGVRGTFQYQVQ